MSMLLIPVLMAPFVVGCSVRSERTVVEPTAAPARTVVVPSSSTTAYSSRTVYYMAD
jgi:hypothetical protein